MCIHTHCLPGFPKWCTFTPTRSKLYWDNIPAATSTLSWHFTFQMSYSVFFWGCTKNPSTSRALCIPSQYAIFMWRRVSSFNQNSDNKVSPLLHSLQVFIEYIHSDQLYMVIPYIQNPRTCHIMVAWNSFNNVTRSTTSHKYLSVADSRHPCHTLNVLNFWNKKLMSLILWNKEFLWDLRPSQRYYWRSKTSGMLCHTDY